MQEVLEKIFKDVFKNAVTFSSELKREDVTLWDSLRHVQLLVAIENEFGVRFDGSDATKMNSISDILEILKEKLQ